MTAMSRPKQMKEASTARRRVEPKPADGRSSRAVGGKPHRDKQLGFWLLPMPTIDPFVVQRSGAALAAYGPTFRYSHFAGTKTLHYAAGGAAGVGAIALAAQVKPLRNLMLGRIKQGEGPDASKREKSWFTVDFIGEGDGRTIHTRVSGGDPGYGETAKMLAESALCLAFDDNPATAGQVTTAQAMGDNLLARLHAQGITFEGGEERRDRHGEHEADAAGERAHDLLGDLLGELQGEAVGVVELAGLLAGNLLRPR
eukprot:gene37941-42973_t